ncbi:phage tail tape measure protein [Terribacillus saccharophilus]|uniref:phage tail tape measure protein n=1 Tax=Terribacillus saccharophilus TaxID=361277 RepID=UPI002DCDFFEE|nr:phage tail tape measure protein [Terribacillus saccharophilus]MEC0288913.1 phage tail tape measure protein [Terribacillus saccharophilus]
MADKERNVVLNFKMDGQVQYAQTLKQINMVMNTAAKEYKNHIAAMGRDASATDKLRAEKKKLEIQMEGAQKRTKMLSAEYEAMAKDTNTSSEQLDRMYGRLLDAERAEISLQKSLNRVNEGLSDQAQEAREAQGVLDQLKNENKLLEAEQKKLTSSFKLQQSELGDNATETEKLELAQRQLSKQSQLTDRTIENLEQQLAATKKIYGENSIEVMQMETKLNEAKNTVSKFEKSLSGLESSGSKAADGLDSLGKKMDLNNLLEATEMLSGVGDQLRELGDAAIQSALEFGDSQTNLQANLGLTADEAENLNGVVSDIFRNGVVSSVDEATDAVVMTKQTFKDLDDVGLEKISNQIIGLSKRTKTDFQENIRGAEQLMNGFGMSGEEALNLISAGYQDGLNRSGDFTDSLVEYAPLFKEAGFSADEMLQIMKNGLDNGARNTDLVVDAVKELQIRMGDGTFEDSLDNFSEGTATVFEEWKNGKATVADVATSVQGDLEKMSPAEQQEALSAISTQFEDLGINASANLFKVGDAFEDVNGKADQMAEKTPGEKWESSLRELQSSLQPIGENLIEALTPILDVLADMGDWFTKLPAPIQTFITIFGGVTGVAIVLAPAIIALAVAFGSLNIALLPITAIILGIAAAIAGIVLVVQNWGAITDWISEKWSQFTTWLSETVSSLVSGFNEWFGNMKDAALVKIAELVLSGHQKFNELKDKAISAAMGLKDAALKKFAELVTSGVDKFNSLKSLASNAVSKLKSEAIKKVAELATGAVNKANELKNNVVNRFNSLKSSAQNTIAALKDGVINRINSLKDGFINTVNRLKDGAINGFNNLKSRTSSIMTSARDSILRPIESARDKIKSIVDRIVGFFTNMKLSIPKIKLPSLPKFSLDGKFSLNPPSVPKLSVKWNAEGAIFTRPTIFGAYGGRLQGAGEAGAEAALPLNSKTLGAIGQGIAKTMNLQQNNRPVTFNLYGTTIREEADIERVSRSFADKVNKTGRGGGNK